MITFLLVISFLLHFITLFALVVLAMRVSKTKELELKQEKVARQVEETFTTYLLEIKEENERLMNILEQTGQTDLADKDRSRDEYSPPEPEEVQKEHMSPLTIEKQAVPEIQGTALQKSGDQDQQPEKAVPSDQKEESYQPSVQSSVFQLYDQGYTTEQIAKRLDCGKTEVELMLKIHPKMNQ